MALSIQKAVSDGSMTGLLLSIDYFDRADISVLFNNTPAAPSAWGWVGTTSKQLTFSPAVPAGVEVTVLRKTDTSHPRHEFTLGAQFNPATLDDNIRQALYAAQEMQEGGASADVFHDMDLHGFRIRNIGPAILPTDAISLAQYQSDMSSPAAASAAAAAAALAANTARDSALAAAAAAGTAADAKVNSLAAADGATKIGFGSRSMDSKARDSMSVRDYITTAIDGVTSNQAGIAAAVQAAKLAGATLTWPAGVYVSTSNIPDFHAVPHTGSGRILRSGYTWCITPGAEDANRICVSPTGSISNDGLSPGFPRDTSSVNLILEGLGSKSALGRWQVEFPAGKFKGGFTSSNMINRFTRFLELRGASQPIPAWTASQAVEYGESRLSRNGNLLYRCVAGGVTGTAEIASRGPLVTDGTVIWSYVGGWLPWSQGQSVTTNIYLKYGGRVYVAKSNGTTGSIPPVHTTGAVSDGGVLWAYIGLDIPIPTLEGATIFDGSLNPPLWRTATVIQTGDARYYGTHCYRSRSVGTSGATAPTHTSGTASDGSLIWEYIGERDTTIPTTCFSISPAPRVNPIYMKFLNYQNTDADAFASGLSLLGASVHLLQYCTFGNCYMGSYHHGKAEPYSQNCVYESCEEGSFCTYHTGPTIGGPNVSNSTFFVNCGDGVYLSRESVAHIDYCVIDRSRGDGVFASVMSRFRSIGTHFLRNNVAIFCIGGSEWGDTPGSDCALYHMTPDANTVVQRLGGFSRWGDGSGIEHQYGDGELRHDSNWVELIQTASAGDAGVNTIMRIMKRLPNKWFVDSYKKVRVVIRGSLSGTAGIKSINVALGSGNLGGATSLPAATTGAFQMEVNIVPTGVNTFASSVRFETAATSFFANFTSLSGFVLDANGQDFLNTIRVYRNLAASGDSITLNSVEVFITG